MTGIDTPARGLRADTFRAVHVDLLTWAALAQFVEGFEMQLVGYAAPAMADALHATKFAFSWVFAANNAGFMLGAIVLSSLGDRIGRKRMLVAGILLFGLFTLAIGYSTTLGTVVLFRFMAGIGLGGAVPNNIALVAEYAPPRRRATALSVLFIAYTAGSFISGFLAAWVLGHHSWDVLFRIGGWIGLAAAILMAWRLPESLGYLARTGQVDRLTAIMRRIEPDYVWTGPGRFVRPGPNAGGIRTLLAAGRARSTLTLWAAAICSIMSLHLLTSWLPTLIGNLGTPVQLAVLIGSLFHLGTTVANLALGRAIDRWGSAAVAVTLLIAGPVVWLLGQTAGPLLLLAFMVAAAGFFVGGGQNGINTLSGLIYPEEVRASGSGWAYGIGRIGSILGPVIGGALLSAKLPVSQVLAVASVPVCVAGVSVLVLWRTLRRSESPEPSAGRGDEA